MLLLIDGYNVIAPIAPPGRGRSDQWLRAARDRLVSTLAKGLGPVLSAKTVVVFDASGAPPGLESVVVREGIRVEFAVGYPEADDRIEELISQHSSPKRLTVVSADHRIQVAAQKRGAMAVDSEVWLDRLGDGRLTLAIPWPPETKGRKPAGELGDDLEKQLDPGSTEEWLETFGVKSEPDSAQKAPLSPFPDGYGEDLV